MMVTLSELWIYFGIMLLVLIAIFLILRELNCWYWKINKKIELQEKTNELLGKILEKIGMEENNQSPR